MWWLTLLLLLWTPAQTPRQALDELFAADRAFAAAGATAADVIAGLSPMFADDVAMPIPGDRMFTRSKTEAIEAMGANPDNRNGRADWTPIGGGISADGQHGFTFGFMTVRRPDASEVALKYLAYWIKTPAGWRAAVYRRRPRGAGAVSTQGMPASLPARLTPPQQDAADIDAARRSLAQAETDFSNDAQTMGLAAAFTKWGRADAINMGPADIAGFIVGNDAIGKSVGAGMPTNSSPVSWAPDHRVIVASSGDLGVTLGAIRASDGKNPPVPFFTIWRRDAPGGQWRYIAE